MLRLRKAACSLGYALGGAAAARLGAHLGMRISGSTVLRELRRAGGAEPVAEPTVIGIADWAIARGHRYASTGIDSG